MWQPDYKSALRERLRCAASMVYQHPGSKPHLEDAAQTILVFRDDEFPADFRTQFQAIMATVTREHTASIPEVVHTLADDVVLSVGRKIVQLYLDTCEPPGGLESLDNEEV